MFDGKKTMEVKAKYKYARIAPKKARDLARSIQGKSVEEALKLTQFSERKAAGLIGKTLKSALANAENNTEMSVENLFVKEAVIDDGPRLKRFWTGARGMYKPVKKRMSHVQITLAERA